MLNRTCREFIDVLASREPVPGGCGASALAGAVGIALGAMVGELTVGKKKYAEHEAEISNLIFRSQELIQKFDELVTKDAEAFLPLAAAYRMPKSTPEEARAQEQAVQEALIAAAQAPLEIAETCLKALRILDSISLIGSRLAVSDAGTGAAICLAALKGARLNVLINLKLMKDEEKRKELSDKLDAITDSGVHLAEITYARVEKACSQ